MNERNERMNDQLMIAVAEIAAVAVAAVAVAAMTIIINHIGEAN